MKIRLTSLFVLLSLSFSLFASNGIPELFKTPPVFDILSANHYASQDILFTDQGENMLFVDFDIVSEEITQLNILRKGTLMMEDDVRDLPGNAIYEINLNVLRKGEYTIELLTFDGLSIHKNIIIK